MDTLTRLTDDEVVAGLKTAVKDDRRSTVELLRWLIEFDRRRLYAGEACPSLFAYCVERLGFSADEAYKRITVARAARERAEILGLIETQRTNLSRVLTVIPVLNEMNATELLERACTMSQHDLEFYVAGLAPKTIARDVIRNIPARQPEIALEATASAPQPALPTPSRPTPPPVDRVEPVSQELARISFTADARTVADIDRACALLRARRGNLGPVIARALAALLREIDPEARLALKRARKAKAADPAKRRIPQALRDAVWKRDGGQCTFRDAQGTRCSSRTNLQVDHVRPWAAGGRTQLDNLRLLCPTHNQAEARRFFGDDRIDRAIAARA